MNLAVAIPSDVVPARYSVSLWMPDEAASLRELPEHAVRFAHHDFYWDSARGYNMLSVLGIEVTP